MTAQTQRRRGHRYWKHRRPEIDDHTPWELDDKCWYVVTCHPAGLTLEQVGDLQDCTRERIRQVEASAKAKIRAAAEAFGLPVEAVAISLGIDPRAFD